MASHIIEMTLPFNVSSPPDADGLSEVANGEFAVDEYKLLCEFREFAVELAAAELLQPGMKDLGNFSWTAGGEVVSTSKTPAVQIHQLLHLLRPFILQRERTYVPNVTGLIGRRIVRSRVHALLGQINDQFLIKPSTQSFTVSSGGVVINSEPTLQAWLNGFEYHRDRNKRSLLRELQTPGVAFDVTRGILADLLFEKAMAVGRVVEFIARLETAPSARNRSAPYAGSPVRPEAT